MFPSRNKSPFGKWQYCKYIAGIKVDDVLVGDVSVDGILKLRGNDAKSNPFYRIYCNELDTDILQQEHTRYVM